MTLENIVSIFLIFIYSQGILLSIGMIFSKDKKRIPIYFLSLFTFIFSFAVLGKLLFFIDIYTPHDHIYYLHTSLLLGMGPAIYHYFKFQLQRFPKLDIKLTIHFLPMLAEYLFYIFVPTQDIINDYNFIYNTEQIVAQISIIFYTLLSYKLINQNIQRNGSNKTVLWYKKLIVLYMLGIIIWIFYVAINIIVFNDEMVISDYFPLYVYAAFVVYAIVYSALLKPLLETRASSEKKQASQEDLDYANQIEEFMRTQKPYLDPNLRLHSFSNRISLPQNTVSSVINTVFQKSFSDYISEYRISLVQKALLTDELERKTIESIAFEHGFKSRSSFHTAFKRVTRLTPKEFIRLNTRSI